MKIIHVIAISFLMGIIGGYLHGKIMIDSYGGVRGLPKTGFSLIEGERIGIGTSSPLYDFVVSKDTGTSTIKMSSVSTSSSACLIMEDYDSAGYSYCNFLNGTQTCSSTNICNN